MIHPFSTDFEEPAPAERRNNYVVGAAVCAFFIILAIIGATALIG
jgi:hypothetical protein